jgi:hypothetical protein
MLHSKSILKAPISHYYLNFKENHLLALNLMYYWQNSIKTQPIVNKPHFKQLYAALMKNYSPFYVTKAFSLSPLGGALEED